MYRCYSCDGLYTTRSGGNRITCDTCGKTFELGDDYRFKSEPYTIANWYDHITEIERKNIREIDLKADVTAKIRSKNGKVRKEHGRARLTFDEFTYESENVSVRYKTENMNAMLFTAGDHFEIYHNDEMYFLCPDEQPQQSARWAHAVDIMCALRKESQRTVKE